MTAKKPKFWDKNYITLYSILLFPLSYLYQIILFIKNFFTKKKKFPISIICVGNIYLGGTGKTPISIKLREMLNESFAPVVIKKNYKGHADEIDLLKKYTKVIVSDTRTDGINAAIDRNFNLVILDDGYQEIGIKKDLNIICFNNEQKIGNGLTLPAGPLRENLSSLKNCDIILINGKKINEFEEKLKKYNNNLKFFYFNYYLKNFDNFKNKKLISFAGIGNPKNFFNLLKANRLNVIREISFPDHYNYSEKDLEKLIEMEKKYNAKLITTEKDFLRISTFERKRFSFLPIKVKIEQEDKFLEHIIKILK
tara:strand:+ start:543 stop:1472 length:930 start_codon:yes stop_codon:yes gene_type:complete